MPTRCAGSPAADLGPPAGGERPAGGPSSNAHALGRAGADRSLPARWQGDWSYPNSSHNCRSEDLASDTVGTSSAAAVAVDATIIMIFTVALLTPGDAARNRPRTGACRGSPFSRRTTAIWRGQLLVPSRSTSAASHSSRRRTVAGNPPNRRTVVSGRSAFWSVFASRPVDCHGDRDVERDIAKGSEDVRDELDRHQQRQRGDG